MSSSPPPQIPPAEHCIYTNRREVAAKEATLEYGMYDLKINQFVMVAVTSMMIQIRITITMIIIMNMV